MKQEVKTITLKINPYVEKAYFSMNNSFYSQEHFSCILNEDFAKINDLTPAVSALSMLNWENLYLRQLGRGNTKNTQGSITGLLIASRSLR